MNSGIVFFEEYFGYMDDMTPEQFYQFMRLIRNLRFNGIDTKVNEVEDKVVRLAWRSVRPSILKSLNNSKEYEKRKKQKQEQEAEETTYAFAYNSPTNECDKWLNDIEKEKGGSAYTAFESGWSKFFTDRDTAKDFVIKEMNRRNPKKHISL